jgi:hypothetical protein
MAITERITLGGAVTTSALVCPDRDALVAAAGGGAGRSGAARGAGGHGGRGDALDLLAQLGRDLFRVGIAQVAHLGVAARLQRRVEVRDQRLQPQPLRGLAAHQHAVGALVGDHLDLRHAGAFGTGRTAGIQAVDDADDLGGACVLQLHDVDRLVALLVDALDDAHHATHVRGAVRDDQHVRGRIGREVPVLRDQRPQDRHQLRGAHVLDGDHLRDDLVGGRADARGQVVGRDLARIGVRDDLDRVAGGHRDEAVHLQDGQEGLVERGR